MVLIPRLDVFFQGQTGFGCAHAPRGARGDRFVARDPIRHLVGDNDGDLLGPGYVSKKGAEPHEVVRTAGHADRLTSTPVELGAVVGRDGVDHDEADAMTPHRHRQLILQDVVLRFNVRHRDAAHTIERRPRGLDQPRQTRMVGEQLRQPSGRQRRLGRDVHRRPTETMWRR